MHFKLAHPGAHKIPTRVYTAVVFHMTHLSAFVMCGAHGAVGEHNIRVTADLDD